MCFCTHFFQSGQSVLSIVIIISLETFAVRELLESKPNAQNLLQSGGNGNYTKLLMDSNFLTWSVKLSKEKFNVIYNYVFHSDIIN